MNQDFRTFHQGPLGTTDSGWSQSAALHWPNHQGASPDFFVNSRAADGGHPRSGSRLRTGLCHAAPKYLACLLTAALWLFFPPGLRAQEATNLAVTPAKHGLNFEFKVGPDKSDATNYYGLPKEAFDRLTPDQIMELAKSNQPPAALIAIVPVAMFLMIIACVWLGVSQRSRRARLLHETLRLMVEKGQPIPPDLLQYSDGFRRPRNDLRTGLILIGVGVGLGVLLLAQGDSDWPVALIPLLMGVAFLVARKLEPNPNGQPK